MSAGYNSNCLQGLEAGRAQHLPLKKFNFLSFGLNFFSLNFFNTHFFTLLRRRNWQKHIFSSCQIMIGYISANKAIRSLEHACFFAPFFLHKFSCGSHAFYISSRLTQINTFLGDLAVSELTAVLSSYHFYESFFSVQHYNIFLLQGISLVWSNMSLSFNVTLFWWNT